MQNRRRHHNEQRKAGSKEPWQWFNGQSQKEKGKEKKRTKATEAEEVNDEDAT